MSFWGNGTLSLSKPECLALAYMVSEQCSWLHIRSACLWILSSWPFCDTTHCRTRCPMQLGAAQHSAGRLSWKIERSPDWESRDTGSNGTAISLAL